MSEQRDVGGAVEEGGDADADGERERRDQDGPDDTELASLRDALVDAVNARDLDALRAVCSEDVECPDLHGDGIEELGRELADIWERVPSLVLTVARCESELCAVAWRTDEQGRFLRTSLVMLQCAADEITCVGLLDDPDRLERADTETPDGEELLEGSRWAEWESGEETADAPERVQT